MFPYKEMLLDIVIIASGPKEHTITDHLLLQTFKVPVKVKWGNGRPSLTINKE